MSKMSGVLDALIKYSKKDMKERGPKKARTKRNKPEKEVEKLCLEWMRQHQWDVQIYESKATFNPRTGHWAQQSMKAGTADCMGCMPDGHMVVIEFKAKGHLRGFNHPRNYRQKLFIKNKIAQNAFTCVVDSPELLQTIYTGWLALRSDKEAAKLFLMKMLP